MLERGWLGWVVQIFPVYGSCFIQKCFTHLSTFWFRDFFPEIGVTELRGEYPWGPWSLHLLCWQRSLSLHLWKYLFLIRSPLEVSFTYNTLVFLTRVLEFTAGLLLDKTPWEVVIQECASSTLQGGSLRIPGLLLVHAQTPDLQRILSIAPLKIKGLISAQFYWLAQNSCHSCSFINIYFTPVSKQPWKNPVEQIRLWVWPKYQPGWLVQHGKVLLEKKELWGTCPELLLAGGMLTSE